MTTPTRWTRLRPRSLVVRIYLACLVLVLVLGAALTFVKRQVLEPSQQRGTVQLARLVGVLAEDAWPDAAALRALSARLRRELDADVTVFSRADAVIASNRATPHPPLAADVRAAALASKSVTWQPPRTPIVPLRHGDDVVGYMLMSPRGPPVDLEASLLALLLVMLLVGAASLLLTRAIARPLGHLTAVARAFGRGDLRARAALVRDDEFGDLGRAFDEMAERTWHLVRAQKELLANVSHELRTPLSRLRVALDLAIEHGGERRMELLTEDVQQDLGELEQLLTDVLVAARLDLSADRATATPLPLKRSVVPLAGLLESSAARFASSHPDRSLTHTAEEALPNVDVDPMLLRRALDNLLDNAARYSGPDAPIALRVRLEHHTAVIEVTDEGVGISDEDQRHIFEPFFRANRARSRVDGGVGLGLVLAQRIAQAHGGDIAVSSSLGKGTTMRLTIPVVTGDV